MFDGLVKAIASRMLLHVNGNEMRLVLRRALQSQAAVELGRAELLRALDEHLSAMLRREIMGHGRLRLIAAKCAAQLEWEEGSASAGPVLSSQAL